MKPRNFICGICSRAYASEMARDECESRGRPATLPAGTILQMPGYKGYAFAIPPRAVAIGPRGHSLPRLFWVTRANGIDTFGTQYAGDTGMWVPGDDHAIDPANLTPEQRRLCGYLAAVGISGSAWTGLPPWLGGRGNGIRPLITDAAVEQFTFPAIAGAPASMVAIRQVRRAE